MAKSYSEKLLDPRWQRKRLDILNRDKFVCTICDDHEDTLHVHHISYEGKKDPWDVADENLTTLCKDCHKMVETSRANNFTLESFIEIHKEPKQVCILLRAASGTPYFTTWINGELSDVLSSETISKINNLMNQLNG